MRFQFFQISKRVSHFTSPNEEGLGMHWRKTFPQGNQEWEQFFPRWQHWPLILLSRKKVLEVTCRLGHRGVSGGGDLTWGACLSPLPSLWWQQEAHEDWESWASVSSPENLWVFLEESPGKGWSNLDVHGDVTSLCSWRRWGLGTYWLHIPGATTPKLIMQSRPCFWVPISCYVLDTLISSSWPLEPDPGSVLAISVDGTPKHSYPNEKPRIYPYCFTFPHLPFPIHHQVLLIHLLNNWWELSIFHFYLYCHFPINSYLPWIHS